MYDNDDGEPDAIPEDLESLEEFPTTPTTEEEDNSGVYSNQSINQSIKSILYSLE